MPPCKVSTGGAVYKVRQLATYIFGTLREFKLKFKFEIVNSEVIFEIYEKIILKKLVLFILRF